MPTTVSSVFTVKNCNIETESSNLCLGKASQYWEEFLWERRTCFSELQKQMW